MRLLPIFLLVHLFFAATAFAKIDTGRAAETFAGKTGCFLVKDLKSGDTVYVFNPEFCKQRFYPCSTFKVPLAVMGFDVGVLKDENTTFKWDGHPQWNKAWEADHTAKSWLKDSVVWYSQRLTPLLGMERVSKYLKQFNYGNQDFSGGLERAWLSSTLKISAEEQVEFLTKLKKYQLKLTADAARKTLALIPTERDDSHGRIAGKTGSCFSKDDPAMKANDPFRLGWYVGYFTHAEKEFVFATVLRAPMESGRTVFGGPEAKKIAVELLDASVLK